MLSMNAVAVIEKRYLDTGIIENDEIMGLVRTIRVKDQQLSGAVKTIEKLSEDKVSIFRDGDGKIIATERTVNVKGHNIFSKIVIGSMLLVTVVEFVQILSLLLQS